jgi:uncharacterized BrkB/YihY/UPF0761 family membrane protein
MNSFVDTIMLLFFLLFMVFIFGGYHKTKAKEREAFEQKKQAKKEKESKKD